MNRIVALGLGAAIVIGCSAAPEDDDDDTNSGTGGTFVGAGSGGVVASASGGTTGSSGTGSGGSISTGTSGSGGVSGGTGGITGSGGTTGTGGTGTGGTGPVADGGMPLPEFMPSCIEMGSELVLIGDSYINYIQNLEPRLRAHAIEDGALAAGDSYGDFARAGTQLYVAFGESIPDQWSPGAGLSPPAKANMPKWVVMDGGGNDVIIGNSMCENDDPEVMIETNASCQKTVKDGMDAAMAMIRDMKASGVQQVLYFYYPNTPIGGHRILDYAFKLLQVELDSLNDDTFRAYLFDNRPVFADHPNDWFSDGIHPTGAGADAMADAIWAFMKTQCMAQTTASGGDCCIP